MREMQILVWDTGIQKENWGQRGIFLEIIKQQLFKKEGKDAVKYKAMYGVFFFFFPICFFLFLFKALISLRKAWLPPNFLFGCKEHLLSSPFFL